MNQEPFINAFTLGSEKPIIISTNKTFECLAEKELEFIVGHEAGHIKSQHCLYHMLAQIFPYLGDLVTQATLGLGGVVITPIQLALVAWQRESEFTADRAGLLACQDVDSAITAFMKMAGAPESQYDSLDPNVFLEQAKKFKQYDESDSNRVAKLLLNMGNSHPWTVMLCSELVSWIDSGAYQALLEERGMNKSELSVCRNCASQVKKGAKYYPKCGKSM